jgi:hypothetical protein
MHPLPERINVYSGTDLAEGGVYEADNLHMLQTKKGGLYGVVLGLIIKCSYTAADEDSGTATIAQLWNVLEHISIKTKRMGVWCLNFPAYKLLRMWMDLGGTFNSHMRAWGLAADATTTLDVSLELPIIFANEFWGGAKGVKSFEGGIPISEFKENAEIKVKIQSGAIAGDDWGIASDVVDLDIDLIVGWSNTLPEPVQRVAICKTETSSRAVLETDKSFPTRLLYLNVSDDDSVTDFDCSGVTQGNMQIDGEYYYVGLDGDKHRAMLNLLFQKTLSAINYETATAPHTIPEALTLVAMSSGLRPNDMPLIRESCKLHDMNGSHSGDYHLTYLLQWRPKRNLRALIMNDMGIPPAIIEQSLEEEDAAQTNAVAYVGNVPSRIVKPDNFEGSSQTEI